MSYSQETVRLLTVHTVFAIRNGIVDSQILCTTDEDKALKEIVLLAQEFDLFPEVKDNFSSFVNETGIEEINEQLLNTGKEIVYRSTQLSIEEEPSAFGFVVEDVLTQAEEDGVELTEDQAKGVLHLMSISADISQGISWDTITYFTNLYLKSHV